MLNLSKFGAKTPQPQFLRLLLASPLCILYIVVGIGGASVPFIAVESRGVATDKVTKCGANDIPEIGH